MDYKLAFYILLWLTIGIWICYKRDWYKATGKDKRAVMFFSIVFTPINLVIVFIIEFIIRKWDEL